MLRAELVVPEAFRCTTRSLLEVIPRAISWVWRGWIPRGSLSLVVGEPGVGKSLCALQLAALATRGGSTMPLLPEREDVALDAPAEQNIAKQSNGFDGDRDTSQSHRSEKKSSDKVGPSNADPALPVSGRALQNTQTPTTESTAPRGTVVLFEPGDGASILRTRLDAAGAAVENIVLVERNWRGDSPDDVEEFLQSEPREPARRPSRIDRDRELRRDLQSLEQHVVQLRHAGHDVSLVIIDPIESLLRDSTDKHHLARLLGELADSLNVAIVAVGTTSSTPRAYPGLRLDSKGIDAFFKASRSVITVVRDPDDEQQRLVLPTKVQLSAAPPGLTFAFADDGTLEWSQTTPLSNGGHPEQTLEQHQNSSAKGLPLDSAGKELNRAKQWLKERLREGGVPVKTLRSEARANEISKATLRRAYEQLGCVSKKSWGSSSGQWVWHLPEVGGQNDAEFVNTTDAQAAESWCSTEVVHEICASSAQ